MRVGATIARAFAAEGTTAIVTDNDAQAARAAAAGPGDRALPLDMARGEDRDALAASRPLADIVGNNAGVTGFGEGKVPD